MVYDHEKVTQITCTVAKFVENYRVFTGNIGKGCIVYTIAGSQQ